MLPFGARVRGLGLVRPGAACLLYTILLIVRMPSFSPAIQTVPSQRLSCLQ